MTERFLILHLKELDVQHASQESTKIDISAKNSKKVIAEKEKSTPTGRQF